MSEFVLVREENQYESIYYIVVEVGVCTAYVSNDLDTVIYRWESGKTGKKFKTLKECLKSVNEQAGEDIKDRVGDLTIVGRGETLQEAVNSAKLWSLINE